MPMATMPIVAPLPKPPPAPPPSGPQRWNMRWGRPPRPPHGYTWIAAGHDLTLHRIGGRGLAGLGGLFGRPQWEYDQVNRLQNDLAILNAEVTVIGKEAWDTVAAQVSKTRPIGAPYFQPYDGVWLRVATFMTETGHPSILITSKYFPSASAIQLAEDAVKSIRPMVEYVKKILPEVRAEADALARKKIAALSLVRIPSPSEAGEAAFKEALAQRAKALGLGLGVGLTTIAVIGIGAMILMSQLGRK